MNEENAMLLLTKVLPRWGDTTCLALADNSHSETFIAHRCCQALLNNLWNGNMEGETQSFFVRYSKLNKYRLIVKLKIL